MAARFRKFVECISLTLMVSFSVKYERIKFLVIALHDSIEIYAWAPKPYHKFMAFKVSTGVVSLEINVSAS